MNKCTIYFFHSKGFATCGEEYLVGPIISACRICLLFHQWNKNSGKSKKCLAI